MAKLTQSQTTELELLVDATSVVDVLNALAEICGEKVDHLRSNWQDAYAARAWEADAKRIDQLVPRIGN